MNVSDKPPILGVIIKYLQNRLSTPVFLMRLCRGLYYSVKTIQRPQKFTSEDFSFNSSQCFSSNLTGALQTWRGRLGRPCPRHGKTSSPWSCPTWSSVYMSRVISFRDDYIYMPVFVVCECVCVRVCMHSFLYVYYDTYIYMFSHVYMFTHIHTHTFINTFTTTKRSLAKNATAFQSVFATCTQPDNRSFPKNVTVYKSVLTSHDH